MRTYPLRTAPRNNGAGPSSNGTGSRNNGAERSYLTTIPPSATTAPATTHDLNFALCKAMLVDLGKAQTTPAFP
ncbi:hypothetical protein RvY_13401 [Ramazzottius varieornatus]|uniref:Uncharacterized protein n=1 Tax=Ramazzottius varieornatus TaxID=947166 RepID=A0A1D1VMS3_RAMVA|nr:hypothetical protein RvY_13401 [Ramazzottius varieornatus]